MKAAPLHALGYPTSPTRRLPKVTAWLLSTMLALITVLSGPMDVHGAQVLELPQTTSPSSGAADPVPIPRSRPPKSNRPMAAPAGVGSVSDYENQDDSAPSSVTSAQAGGHFDRRDNRAAMANDLIMGALVLGVLAMEFSSAHHHR